jgi:DNA-binding GntR family transcriptional regulator
MTPDEVAEVLRQAIRERVLVPGAPLVQDDLARRLGTSRMPVREALRILASEGVIQMTRGSGATVSELRADEVAELYELRLKLEPDLAEAIVGNCRAPDLERFKQLLAEMARAKNDPGRWARANFEFHAMQYDLARRPHTQRILAGLLTMVQPYSMRNVNELGGRSDADHEHVGMVRAIEERNPREFARLVRQHLSTARDRLLKSFAAAGDADPLKGLRDLADGGGARGKGRKAAVK